MSDFKCPFCGSAKLLVDTPYLTPVTHEPIQQYCCKKQHDNALFVQKKYTPGNRPSIDNVSKV